MDAVKRRYAITNSFSNTSNPDYLFYSVRKGKQPLPPGTQCDICLLVGRTSTFGPADISNKGHQYQPCRSGEHQLYWNERIPMVQLPGRPSPVKVPYNPDQIGCTVEGCNGRLPAACGTYRCKTHCVDYAHGQASDNDNSGSHEELDDAIPPPPAPPPTQPARNAQAHAAPAYRPNPRAAPGTFGQQQRNVPSIPFNHNRATQPERVNPDRPMIPLPRRRGELAMPVAPLPAGIPLGGRSVTLNSDHRLQRLQVTNSLTRLSREENAMALQRHVKVTMWASANTISRTEVVTNSKSSSNAVVLAHHPSIIEHLAGPDDTHFQVQVYDWNDKEWLMSGPDVPHPLSGHDRLLVRSPYLSDGECLGLNTYLVEAEEPKINAPRHPKKRSHSEMRRDSKGKGPMRTIKLEPKEPSTSTLHEQQPSMALPLLSPSPPPQPQKKPKPRRLNPDSRSWIMQQTYGTVARGLEHVHRFRNKGYEVLDSINASFKSGHVSRSTWQRHDALYHSAPDKLKSEWMAKHADRLWAEFWSESSGLSGMDADRSEDASSDDSDNEEAFKIKEELLPQLQMTPIHRQPQRPSPSTRATSGSIMEPSEPSSDDVPTPELPKRAVKKRRVEIIELSD